MTDMIIPGTESAFAVEDMASWRALFPQLRICDPRSAEGFAPFAVDAASAHRLNQLLREEGYFQLDPPAWGLSLSALADVVIRLHRSKIPTGYAFVYDEFWLLFLKLHHLLGAVLGTDYKLRSDFWAWCVDPAADEAGWPPHRDQARDTLRPDGTAKTISIWLPLTDATPLNGCMYVLPADRDRHYGLSEEIEVALADVRALPAAAGSILGWAPPLLHWGSHACKRAAGPRVSVAYEFQRGDEEPFGYPLIPPRILPTFDERLSLIAKQVLQYRHRYPLSDELAELAERRVRLPWPGSAR